MELTAKQIKGKPKKIGTLHGKDVLEIETKGGLYLDVVSGDKGKLHTISMGPHKAMARHMARKAEPDLVLTELSKSDWLDPWVMEPLLPKYEALTLELQRLELERG